MGFGDYVAGCAAGALPTAGVGLAAGPWGAAIGGLLGCALGAYQSGGSAQAYAPGPGAMPQMGAQNYQVDPRYAGGAPPEASKNEWLVPAAVGGGALLLAIIAVVAVKMKKKR